MVKSRHYVKVCEFDGMPKLSDFKIVEEEIDPTLKDGEILTEALVISPDPFNRSFPVPPNTVMIGFQAAKVLESKNPKYPKGSHVLTKGGWKTVCKLDESDPDSNIVWSRFDQVQGDLSTTLFTGALGMPGMTAYLGFQKVCEPKAGETVMVTGCAGAVGSLVGQIAKIRGCRVIGSCGSDEKVAWVKSIGFDDAFNYKTEKSWPEALKRMAPNGIDCFFDNVAGEMAEIILVQLMNEFGRVACCGAISGYNDGSLPTSSALQFVFIAKQMKMQGFNLINRWHDEVPAGIKQMADWVREGKIKTKETISEGFEDLPNAFIRMLSGKNVGKTVVKLY